MASGVVPIVYDNQGERELVGPPFAANVIVPDLSVEAMTAGVTRIVRRYDENRLELAKDRETARAYYLARYTEDRFRDGLNAIVDGCCATT